MFNKKPTGIKKIIGLRNMVTDGKQWKYLVFYDVDNPSEGDIREIISVLEDFEISYIIYKTKHGIHVVGLTPLDLYSGYAPLFDSLQDAVPEYYAGQTIRLSRKEGEIQELITYNLEHPLMVNLLSLYEKRFPQIKESYPIRGSPLKEYHLVFEKYWSKKV